MANIFSHAIKTHDGYEIHTNSGRVVIVNSSNEGLLQKDGKTFKLNSTTLYVS